MEEAELIHRWVEQVRLPLREQNTLVMRNMLHIAVVAGPAIV